MAERFTVKKTWENVYECPDILFGYLSAIARSTRCICQYKTKELSDLKGNNLKVNGRISENGLSDRNQSHWSFGLAIAGLNPGA